MLDAFADAADPDAGLKAYRQVSDALGRTPWYLRLLRDEGTGGGTGGGGAAERLARLLASSPYVADLMTRAPESVRLVRSLDELKPRTREQVATALLSVVRRNTELGGSGRRRPRRCGASSWSGWPAPTCWGCSTSTEVGAALSDAAAATLAAALDVASRKVEVELRGPLPATHRGHRHGPARRQRDRLRQRRRRHVRLREAPAGRRGRGGAGRPRRSPRRCVACSRCRRPDPPLLLDLGLRPEGRQGPLARSLASYAAYYRRWSIGWEAQALLRAVPIAGDVELGLRFLELADAVRFPATLSAVGRRPRSPASRRRMERERMPKGVDRTLHLKLGPGGLTDVEWAAQLLQLQNGARVPELRTSSTLDALAAAAEAGLLTRRRRPRCSATAGGGRCGCATPSSSPRGRRSTCCRPAERAIGRVAQVLGGSARRRASAAARRPPEPEPAGARGRRRRLRPRRGERRDRTADEQPSRRSATSAPERRTDARRAPDQRRAESDRPTSARPSDGRGGAAGRGARASAGGATDRPAGGSTRRPAGPAAARGAADVPLLGCR